MRLKYQIFLTLLAASALLIATMFAISSWSFSRGFLNYVNQNEASRLSPIAERLVYNYEESGNWDWVEEIDLRQFRPTGERGRGPRARPAGETANTAAKSNGPLELDKPRRPRPPRGERRGPALVLTDANKAVILGKINRTATMEWLALESNERVVGFLGFPRSTRVDRYFDQIFADKQKKTFAWTALAMVLLSGLLSIPLASRIVRPLLKVNEAVDEISGGNFAHRVENLRHDELGDLAKNINTLGVTLEENRNARQRWIAEISHELRTPLAVMRGEVEAVQDGVRVMDKPALDSLHSEVLGLSRLVDDLHTLSMSDVGALSYQMETLDVSQLLSEFLDSNQQALVQRDIKLTLGTFPAHTAVQGDAQRIEQLFSNLFQNTCRYTDTGGQLQIVVRNENQDGQDRIVIDWIDSSPGVNPSALPQLFDPLFRAEDSRNRALGGSGLGLSIAKRIVDAHQGSIQASASSFGGLHISIALPLTLEPT